MYGISLITHRNGARAWRVTLYRDRRKQTEREFPFLKCGGEGAALSMAKAFRDEQLLLSPPRMSREIRGKMRSTNTSGHPGVTRYRMGKYWYWVAQTKLRDGKPIKKSFRVDRYGDQEAKALAIAERERQLAQITHRAFRSPEAEEHYANLRQKHLVAPSIES